MESENVQKFVIENEMPSGLLEQEIKEVVAMNTAIVKNNLKLFLTDDVKEFYESVVLFTVRDLNVMLESYAEIYSDANLSLTDKNRIITEMSEDAKKNLKRLGIGAAGVGAAGTGAYYGNKVLDAAYAEKLAAAQKAFTAHDNAIGPKYVDKIFNDSAVANKLKGNLDAIENAPVATKWGILKDTITGGAKKAGEKAGQLVDDAKSGAGQIGGSIKGAIGDSAKDIDPNLLGALGIGAGALGAGALGYGAYRGLKALRNKNKE
jgi:hypothetical protein